MDYGGGIGMGVIFLITNRVNENIILHTKKHEDFDDINITVFMT